MNREVPYANRLCFERELKRRSELHARWRFAGSHAIDNKTPESFRAVLGRHRGRNAKKELMEYQERVRIRNGNKALMKALTAIATRPPRFGPDDVDRSPYCSVTKEPKPPVRIMHSVTYDARRQAAQRISESNKKLALWLANVKGTIDVKSFRVDAKKRKRIQKNMRRRTLTLPGEAQQQLKGAAAFRAAAGAAVAFRSMRGGTGRNSASASRPASAPAGRRSHSEPSGTRSRAYTIGTMVSHDEDLTHDLQARELDFEDQGPLEDDAYEARQNGSTASGENGPWRDDEDTELQAAHNPDENDNADAITNDSKHDRRTVRTAASAKPWTSRGARQRPTIEELNSLDPAVYRPALAQQRIAEKPRSKKKKRRARRPKRQTKPQDLGVQPPKPISEILSPRPAQRVPTRPQSASAVRRGPRVSPRQRPKSAFAQPTRQSASDASAASHDGESPALDTVAASDAAMEQCVDTDGNSDQQDAKQPESSEDDSEAHVGPAGGVAAVDHGVELFHKGRTIPHRHPTSAPVYLLVTATWFSTGARRLMFSAFDNLSHANVVLLLTDEELSLLLRVPAPRVRTADKLDEKTQWADTICGMLFVGGQPPDALVIPSLVRWRQSRRAVEVHSPDGISVSPGGDDVGFSPNGYASPVTAVKYSVGSKAKVSPMWTRKKRPPAPDSERRAAALGLPSPRYIDDDLLEPIALKSKGTMLGDR